MAEINSVETRATDKGKRKADHEPLTARHQLSRLLADYLKPTRGEESDDGGSSSGSDSGDGESHKRRKLRSKDMPWYNREGEPAISTNPSCAKSANLIRKFNKDIKSAKLFIQLTPGAPRGIPMSEWEHIFKGEAVDLNKILSSLHCITVDQERKACVGDTEISIGGTEMKRKVESSLEWSTAWRSTS